MMARYSIATYFAAAALWAQTAALLPGPALAHGDLAMEDSVCRLKAGPFQFRLTGYQAATGPGREFCEDIPRTGQTVMVFESTGLPVDGTTIDIRIVRDLGRQPEDEGSIFPVTQKMGAIPRGGGVSIEYDFTERGRYVGLLTVHGGDRVYVGRFPFTVGAVRAAQLIQFALEAVLLTVVLLNAGRFARLRRRPPRRKSFVHKSLMRKLFSGRRTVRRK
jgi:hypothetical protein